MSIVGLDFLAINRHVTNVITLSVSGPVPIEVHSPDNATLVITWRPPINPNGVILIYSVFIIDISVGSTVRQESVIPTDMLSITETGLGSVLQQC